MRSSWNIWWAYFQRWNKSGDPFPTWAVVFTISLSLLLLHLLFGCSFPHEWNTIGAKILWDEPLCPSNFWLRLLISYLGITLLLGTLITLFFTELNRKILRNLQFRQRPNLPRFRSIYTGIVERILLTTFGIAVLFNPLIIDPAQAAGVALVGGYLALKQYYTEVRGRSRKPQSIHAIWGSGLSVGIAMLASWWFWQLAPPASQCRHSGAETVS